MFLIRTVYRSLLAATALTAVLLSMVFALALLGALEGLALVVGVGAMVGLAAWLLSAIGDLVIRLVPEVQRRHTLSWSMQLDNISVRIPHRGLCLRYSDVVRLSSTAEVHCTDGSVVCLAPDEPRQTQRWLAWVVSDAAAKHTMSSPEDVPASIWAARRQKVR